MMFLTVKSNFPKYNHGAIMKNLFRRYIMAALALSMAFGLYACTDDNGVVDPAGDFGDEHVMYLISDFDTQPSEVAGESAGENFSMHPPRRPGDMEDRGGFMRPVKRFPLMPLFRQLQLTDSQRVQVGRMLHAHHDCIRAIMMRLHQSERAIFERAATVRDSLRASYRNGEMTAEEFRASMLNLMRRLRHALSDNPARIAAKEAIQDCWDEFFRRLNSILDEDQQAKLARFLENLPDDFARRGPMNGRGGPGGGRGPGNGDCPGGDGN